MNTRESDRSLEFLSRYFKAQEVRHAQRIREWKAWADEWDRTSDARVVFVHYQELIDAVATRPTMPRHTDTQDATAPSPDLVPLCAPINRGDTRCV